MNAPIDTSTPPTSAEDFPSIASDAARLYIDRGYRPIPLRPGSKKALRSGGVNLVIARGEVDGHFTDRTNVGLAAGEPSDWLVDVDLDCSEARALASAFLPKTAMVHGRVGAPESHFWYVAEGAESKQFSRSVKNEGEKKGKEMFVEIRSTNIFTMVPPSVHPDREILGWSRFGEPAHVDAGELQECVSRLAAAALLARHWPGQGTRQKTAMAAAGFLLRSGLGVSETEEIIFRAAQVGGDPEAEKRRGVVADTDRKLEADEHVTGGPRLAELLPEGPEVPEVLRKWLGLRTTAECAEKSVETWLDKNKDSDKADPKPILKDLAALDEIRFARVKKTVAKAAGISVSDLTKFVKGEANRGEDRKETEKRANLPGLVDIVLDGSGKPVYLFVENGKLATKESFELPEGLLAVPPTLEKMPWHLPTLSKVKAAYENLDTAVLWAEVRQWLKDAAVLPDDRLYDVLTAWVIHTYLLETVDHTPIIAFDAVPARGKTRIGKALTYAARRGVECISVRAAYLFRYSHWATMMVFLDVSELMAAVRSAGEGVNDLILGRFEKGAKVPRVLYPDAGPFDDTEWFDVFGPMVVATNEAMSEVLSTRALLIQMKQVKCVFQESVKPAGAAEIRNRLCALRAQYLDRPLAHVEKTIVGRLGDISLPLLQVAKEFNPEMFEQIKSWLLDYEEEASSRKAETAEGRILRAFASLAASDQANPSRGMPGHYTVLTKDISDSANIGLADQFKTTSISTAKKLRQLGFKLNRSSSRNLSQVEYHWKDLETACVEYSIPVPPVPPEAPEAPGNATDRVAPPLPSPQDDTQAADEEGGAS